MRYLCIAVAALALLAGCEQAEERAAKSDFSASTTAPSGGQEAPSDTDSRIYLDLDEAKLGSDQGIMPAGVRSLIKTDGRMKHGEFRWDEAEIGGGKVQIFVDLDRQMVSAYRGGHEIGTAVILFGAFGKDTPLGSFPIERKISDYHSRTYDAPMPYTLWLTDDGVALHGSKVEWGASTRGCVGVPIEFAEHLFDVTREGDVVRIVRSQSNEV